MSTLSKDRASLCTFTFADGRRCRTPRHSGHPHLCYFHARKEAQARAAEQLGRDFAYFFSGKYLSACDLSAALGRLFVAVAQGHVKPKTAATLAYLAQTLLQTIRVAEQEYINAFETDAWRDAVHSSVTSNFEYQAQSEGQLTDQVPRLRKDQTHNQDSECDDASSSPSEPQPLDAALAKLVGLLPKRSG